jgi:4-amino-4-deoxy-L-arabinose transferase-like glycosyltransferase
MKKCEEGAGMGVGSVGDKRITPVGWVLLIGGLLRLAIWLSSQNLDLQIFDERDYHGLAANLARYGEYSFRPGKPVTIRPPLYPALVAGVYKAAGVGNFQAVRLVQAGLSLVTVWLLYLLGARLYDRRVGAWLAGLYCFYPSMLGYNDLLLTEVLFTALLVAACYAMVSAVQESSLPLAMVSGALIGLSALTRSVMWLFPAPLAALLLLTWNGPFGRRLLAVAAVSVSCAAVIAPWAVRCSSVERTFTPVDCMGGRNFMMGNYEFTPLFRAWDAISEQGERSWDQVLAKSDPAFAEATQGQRDKLALRYGLGFVAAHPGLTLKRDVVKFLCFWGLERELVAGAARGYFGRLPAVAVVLLALVIVGSYAVAVMAGAFGAFVAPPPDRRAHLFFLLTIAFICGMHTLTFGHSRYHLPVMPLVLAYSAAALVHAGEVWRLRSTAPFGLAACFNGLLVFGWVWVALASDRQEHLGAILGH